MQELQDASNLIVGSAREFWQAIGAFMPKLLGAFLLVVVGALFAKAAEGLTRRLCRFLGLNDFFDKNKSVKQTLKKTGLDINVVNVVSRIVFWLVIIVFAMTAADVLELTAMRDVIRELLAYLPRVLAAAIVLTITIAGARLVRDAVAAALAHMSVDYAGTVASVAGGAIIVFGSLMAVDQLGFDTTIIAANLTIIVSGVVLALALAFGLGGREVAGRILDQVYERVRRTPPK